MIVCRMTTLTLSNTPVRKSIASESQRERESPKTIVAAPKPATHQSSVRPACFIGGRYAIRIAITNAPMPGAARIQPSPIGPQCRILSAKIGSKAVAPPSSTATMSSVIVARITFLPKTNCSPSTRLRQVLLSTRSP